MVGVIKCLLAYYKGLSGEEEGVRHIFWDIFHQIGQMYIIFWTISCLNHRININFSNFKRIIKCLTQGWTVISSHIFSGQSVQCALRVWILYI
ncbi:hypothetical protein CHUAL_004420 [Chamberlinius hualienensis]